MRSKTLLLFAVAALAAAFASPARAELRVESLTLDTHQDPASLDTSVTPPVPYAGPATSTTTLAAGRLYVVRVQGTWSPFSAHFWSLGPPFGVCGTSEAAPQFASPGVTNGPVGDDAEVAFARPIQQPCTISFPHHLGTFQENLGSGWQHYEPLFGPFSSPSADHAYWYVFRGQGSPISFRQVDNTADDYGVFHILLFGFTADRCKDGGWQLYGRFKNQGDCVSFVATDGRNQPSGVSSPGSASYDN